MTMKPVEVGELFYGFPIFVLTYEDERTGWNMTVCSSSFALRKILVFGLRAQGGATAQIKRTGRCTVSVIAKAQMPIIEKLGRLHGTVFNEDGAPVGVDKIAASGAGVATLPETGAKYLEGAQLVFDLEIESSHDVLKETVFSAKILGQYADSRLLHDETVDNDDASSPEISPAPLTKEEQEAVSKKISPVLFVGADYLLYKYFSSDSNRFGDFSERK